MGRALQDGAAALFSKRVDLLAGEADEQTIFLLMFGDVFDDVRDRLSHGHPLNCSFATQLLRHHPTTNKWLNFAIIVYFRSDAVEIIIK